MIQFVPRPIVSTLSNLQPDNLPKALLAQKRWVCVRLGAGKEIMPLDSLGCETPDEIHVNKVFDAMAIAENHDRRRRPCRLAFYHEDRIGQPSLITIRLLHVTDRESREFKPWVRIVLDALEPLAYAQRIRDYDSIEILCLDPKGPKRDSKTIETVIEGKIEIERGTRLILMTGDADYPYPIGDFEKTYDCLKRLTLNFAGRSRQVDSGMPSFSERACRRRRAAELLDSVEPKIGESLMPDQTWQRAIRAIRGLGLKREEQIAALESWSRSKAITIPDMPIRDLVEMYGNSTESQYGNSRSHSK